MTADDMKLLEKIARGPIDAYDIHYARIALGTLLAEYRELQRLNESLCERIAAQSGLLSRIAEKPET